MGSAREVVVSKAAGGGEIRDSSHQGNLKVRCQIKLKAIGMLEVKEPVQ